MVYINEWLPNPIGSDLKNEWIELYNDSNQSINLSGWTIFSQNKSYKIKNKIIQPHSYLVLTREETKLSFLNQNGEIKLLDFNGNVVDKANFFGSAPEGKSFSRFNNDFFFTIPTPGKKNEFIFSAQIDKNYPENIVLNQLISTKEIIFLDVIVGILLSLIIWFIIKNDENFKELFF